MIPAALIGILAINRLGAIHAVVFGGFAANALAQRIEASQPVAILTASCGIDGNKPPMNYRPFVEEAVRISSHKPEKVIVWQREQIRWHPIQRNQGERNWQSIVKSARARGVRAECVPVKSTDPIYIIHTSGTTGTPKGVLRDAGGHAVGLHLTISYIFNIHGPGCVAFTASDIGWVVGHSYILYGPLLTGAATVLYEGKPVGTPDASAFWRVVEEYKVNTMFTAPTALRAIKRDDPDNKLLKEIGERGGLRSLKSLFLAGERSEPAIITSYQDSLSQYGAPDAHVVDNWWSTESGSPITARALVPHAGKDRKTPVRNHPPPKIKPGSAGKAMPGFDVRIVDDLGKEVDRGTMGNIVLALPLAPTGFRTLWRDEERFWKGYLKRFGGRWLDTGDSGWVDKEGYVHVMSRNDDVLNVSAHRLSSGKIPSKNSKEFGAIWFSSNHGYVFSCRRHRASGNKPPPRRRSLRGRHPGLVKGSTPFHIRHTLHPEPSHVRGPGPQALRGGAGPRAESGRRHREPRRHDCGQGHDPQDSIGEDAQEGAKGVA
jgi:propionyl-CoA synthetase